jgi:hypothetical protein
MTLQKNGEDARLTTVPPKTNREDGLAELLQVRSAVNFYVGGHCDMGPQLAP